MAGIADIGRTLAAAREARGLTQRELGNLVGVKQQQIARWEAASYRSATLARVDEVLRALDVNVVADNAHPLAAEPAATYATTEHGTQATPARDLADVISRIRSHSAELRGRFTLRRVGVYGSYLAGEQREDSDIDVLAELDDVNFDNEFGAAAYLQGLLGRKVDFALPSELRPELAERVLDEVLYVWEA